MAQCHMAARRVALRFKLPGRSPALRASLELIAAFPIQHLCYNLGRPIAWAYPRQVKLDSMSYDQQRAAWAIA